MEAKNERKELERALAALEDGSGHEEWGPGPVGAVLIERGCFKASWAFDRAAQLAVMTGRTSKESCIAFMRIAAPALLEAMEKTIDGLIGR